MIINSYYQDLTKNINFYTAKSIAQSAVRISARGASIVLGSMTDTEGLAKIVKFAQDIFKTMQRAFDTSLPVWLKPVISVLSENAKIFAVPLELFDLSRRLNACVNWLILDIGVPENIFAKISTLAITAYRAIGFANALESIKLCSLASALGRVPVLNVAIRNISALQVSMVALIFDTISNCYLIYQKHTKYNHSVDIHKKVAILWNYQLEYFKRSAEVGKTEANNYQEKIKGDYEQLWAELITLRNNFLPNGNPSHPDLQRFKEQLAKLSSRPANATVVARAAEGELPGNSGELAEVKERLAVFGQLYKVEKVAVDALLNTEFTQRFENIAANAEAYSKSDNKKTPVILNLITGMSRRWDMLEHNQSVGRAKPWIGVAANVIKLFSVFLVQANPWLVGCLPTVVSQHILVDSVFMLGLSLVVSGSALAKVFANKATIDKLPAMSKEDDEAVKKLLLKWAKFRA